MFLSCSSSISIGNPSSVYSSHVFLASSLWRRPACHVHARVRLGHMRPRGPTGRGVREQRLDIHTSGLAWLWRSTGPHTINSMAAAGAATCTHTQQQEEEDERFMRRAIALSLEATHADQLPFGALLVGPDGNVLAEAANSVIALGGDVTAHAETNLVRKVCGAGPTFVPPEVRARSTVYSSAEPCVMCAGALGWSGVGRVVYGCRSSEMAKITGPGGFDAPLDQMFAFAPRKITIGGPLLEDEALHVHRGFWGVKGLARGAPAGNAAVAADVGLERALLASGAGSTEAVTPPEGEGVQVIDMSQGDEACAEALWQAASTCGFFTLVGHGIPQDDIDTMFQLSEQFFAQDLAAKEAAAPYSKDQNSGYEHMKQVRPSTGTPDRKESFQITAREGCMDGRWPAHPEGFERGVTTLLSAARKLAVRILTLLEPRACPMLEPGTLAGSHTLWGPQGQCTLRLLHYMPMTAAEREAAAAARSWRAGAHTDWSCLTLLFQRPGGAGLECTRNPRCGAVGWVPVDPVPGGVVVNIGDMLARWSSGRLYSNLHRVRLPRPEECEPPRSRHSLAFFMQADRDALLLCEGHELVTAGEYLLGRIRSNFEK